MVERFDHPLDEVWQYIWQFYFPAIIKLKTLYLILCWEASGNLSSNDALDQRHWCTLQPSQIRAGQGALGATNIIVKEMLQLPSEWNEATGGS